ncbi:nucleoside triphosphate pyrophosphohydrolase [bacterium MnTg02]|nr:nucleoside triphosphate pyrophosphohydrolase [bacterium MnTg02]
MSGDSSFKSERKTRASIDALLEIMRALRTPVTGCPWDLEQTFETIAPYTIEEAYEVADAIERDNMDDLRQELGDLLLQVVYHAQIASESGRFDFSDVVESICEKMVRRHPHVFGTKEQRDAGAPPGFWDRIKAEEKAEQEAGEKDQSTASQSTPSLLDDVPLPLPGLTRAVKLQKRAAQVGFDWPNLEPVIAKIKEELVEFESALRMAQADPYCDIRNAHIEEELGDLLFVLANAGRHLNIDPETALRGTNAKFARRFKMIEARLAEDGRSPAQSDLAEMDRLWDEIKVEEKKSEAAAAETEDE